MNPRHLIFVILSSIVITSCNNNVEVDDISKQEQEISAILPIQPNIVKLEGLHKDSADEILSVFKVISKSHPEILINTTRVTTFRVEKSTNQDNKQGYRYKTVEAFTESTYCYVLTEYIERNKVNYIFINENKLDTLKKAQKSYDNDVWNRFHIKSKESGLYSLMMHEFGHLYDQKNDLSGSARVKKIYEDLKDQLESVRKTPLSIYAGKTIYEFVAECFMDVECNGDDAKEISKTVIFGK